MQYSKIGPFMSELKQRNSNSARALEYVILTAMRTETVQRHRGEASHIEGGAADLLQLVELATA